MHTTTITTGPLAGLQVLAGRNGTPCAYRRLDTAKKACYAAMEHGYLAALTCTWPRFVAVKERQ
jgi:hypothetical protein